MKTIRLRLVFALTVACVVAGIAAGIALAQGGFEFRFGFAALADQIPAVVGQPLENEHHAANGDSLQRTTTGLMVWRKADNWTAFTNGSRTWVNGPEGLQERGNEERFNWERRARAESTQVITFRPAGVRGPEQEGYCFAESLSSGQADAWRCMADNRIYDPCFAVEGERGSVVCGASPTGDQYGFRLRLNQPLPAREAQPREQAWLLELANGVTCGYLTGASTGVEGERANYGCSDGWYILGDPQPGPVWTAREVSIEVTSQGPTLVDSAEVNIETVWR